jgi:hypothetical protein
MAKIAKRKKSRKAKKSTRRHGLSAWNRFVKAHKGKGHSMATLGRMYRKAGHGVKKGAKKGRRKARRSSVPAMPKSFGAKVKGQLVREFTAAGLSLAEAKKQANKEIYDGLDLGSLWQTEFKTKWTEERGKFQKRVDEARTRAEEAEDKKIEKELEAQAKKAEAKLKKELSFEEKARRATARGADRARKRADYLNSISPRLKLNP